MGLSDRSKGSTAEIPLQLIQLQNESYRPSITTTTIVIRAQKLYRVTLIQERKITKEEGTAT